MSDTPLIDVAGRVRNSITDGPGLRYALFVQGCPHCCEGCHNAHTWPFGVGEKRTAADVFAEIAADPIIRGVTFTGGEPLSQAGALIPLARMVKERGLELAIYTGYTFEQAIELGPDVSTLLSLADVLVDGPFVLRERTLELKFRGSKNQRVLDLPASLAAKSPVLVPEGRWR